MWGHQELREVYKKSGWKEQDFVSKSVAARNAAGANSPTANNTLNRPMASQGGTRYEDRTIQRSNNQAKHLQYQRVREERVFLFQGGRCNSRTRITCRRRCYEAPPSKVGFWSSNGLSMHVFLPENGIKVLRETFVITKGRRENL